MRRYLYLASLLPVSVLLGEAVGAVLGAMAAAHARKVIPAAVVR